jgi:hypothetical protein
MRCAIVEHNWYHDEVIPTLAYALNQLGFEVDVFLPKSALAANAFTFAGDLRYRTHAIDTRLGRLMGTPPRYRRYDLTVLNSIEPVEVMRASSGLPGPLLAVVHNASLLRQDPEYAAYFEPARRAPVVLWKHVAAYLAPEWNAQWIAPIYFGDVPRPDRHPAATTFCVQGNFAFDRRNYDSLATAAEHLIGAGQTGFRVLFVGRSDSPDGLEFRAQLARTTASTVMEFSASGIPYRDYYSTLAAADFILPLIDTSTDQYAYYFADKATSSLAVSIGLGVVPVVHSRLASQYEVADAGICYQNGQLAQAMSQALALGSEEGAGMRLRLHERRRALLSETVANLRRAVDTVS